MTVIGVSASTVSAPGWHAESSIRARVEICSDDSGKKMTDGENADSSNCEISNGSLCGFQGFQREYPDRINVICYIIIDKIPNFQSAHENLSFEIGCDVSTQA
jgi:hypothetical protein